MGFTFDEIPESTGGYAILPKGHYRIECIEAKRFKPKDDSDFTLMQVIFRILDADEHANSQVDQMAELSFTWRGGSENAIKRTYAILKRMMGALGIEPSGQRVDDEFDLTTLIQGRDCWLEIDHNDYNGKTYMQPSFKHGFYSNEDRKTLFGDGRATSAPPNTEGPPKTRGGYTQAQAEANAANEVPW